MTKFLENIEINYLTPSNSVFRISKGGLIEMDYIKDGKTETFSPVVLHLAYPFMKPREYVSVFSSGGDTEIGIILNLSEFDEATAEILYKELRRRYYTPIIKKIISINERFGFSYWKVDTDKGEINFAVSDTYKSIIRFSTERYIIIDADGNRYSVNNINELDGVSIKKLEMYV